MDPKRKEVFYYALASRGGFLLLSAFADLLIPNYHSDGFKTASFMERDYYAEDSIIWRLFGGLLHWDAHHFLHIAQYGYSYENNIAFFPLFPLLVRAAGDLVVLSGLVRSSLTAYLLVAVVINNLVFIKSALVLYDLTLFIFHDTGFAYRTAIFFCVSPATVFFIAPYTETLFAYCAFSGMLEFSRRRTKHSLFWFILSVCFRSNGVTFAGFILHAWAYYCLSQSSLSSLKYNINLISQFTFHTLQYVLYIFSPFLLFQLYSYLVFCVYKPVETHRLILDHGDVFNLNTPSDYISWCEKGFNWPYFAVQEKYWNVGFLKYYTIWQIPNFLLAFPVCYIVIKHSTLFLRKNIDLLYNPKRIYSFGVFLAEAKKMRDEYPPSVFLFFGHALFLTLWGLLNINVQVLTRLLASSSPVLYWIAANHFNGLPQDPTTNGRKLVNNLYILPFEKGHFLDTRAYFIKYYFLSYAFIGIVLFNNGLPWT